jgi:predicted RNA polymerase sigma factor
MLLLESPATARPDTYALAALMFLHASRLSTRLDVGGDLNPLLEQDRSRWDRRLVEEGVALLERSATGSVVSVYHLEAAIAEAHATACSIETTNWTAIVHLYDRLMDAAPSPVVALNRAIAIGQADGPEPGLAALRSIPDAERLRQYPFYAAALGELELRRGNLDVAREQFASAAALARNPAERRFLERRCRECLMP